MKESCIPGLDSTGLSPEEQHRVDFREINETFHPFQERLINISKALNNPDNQAGRYIQLVYSDYGYKTWLWKLHNIYKATEMGNHLYGFIPLPADKTELSRILGEIAANENLVLTDIVNAYHTHKEYLDGLFGKQR